MPENWNRFQFYGICLVVQWWYSTWHNIHTRTSSHFALSKCRPPSPQNSNYQSATASSFNITPHILRFNVWLYGKSVVLYSRGAQIPGTRSPVATKLCTVAPNICGLWLWRCLHVTLLAPRIRRWIPDFFINLCIPSLLLYYQRCSVFTAVFALPVFLYVNATSRRSWKF